MLPGQILLNNLLYDTWQLAIPTDRVDPEQLQAPSHWNIAFIRRFMLTFGPISSLFDFLTFGLMLGILHAGPDRVPHRLVRRIPGDADVDHLRDPHPAHPVPRSRPGGILLSAACVVVLIGIALTYSPAASALGFAPLPWYFFGALAAMTVAYLVLVEFTKKFFYGAQDHSEGNGNGAPADAGTASSAALHASAMTGR